MRLCTCLALVLLPAVLEAQPTEQGRGLRMAVAAEARTALVIGNGAYRDAPLRNPVNDARAMAEVLRAEGFQVIALEDASLQAMRQGLRDFGGRIGKGGVGLFYYAGHGMQVKGRNYLIPVGADIQAEDEVAGAALDVDTVLAKLESARNRLNILILDACRNDPFARSFRGGSQGLAPLDAPTGTFIAFATAPGRAAADGSGPHGLYTGQLLQAIQTPGLKLEDTFKRVLSGVRRASRDQQIPWTSSSVEGDFYFVPGSAAASPSADAFMGNLRVAVTGAEARISLDGSPRGLARPDEPLVITGLIPGELKLRAEAPDCLPLERTVRVDAGQWQQVSFPMKKGGRLLLYRLPSAAIWKSAEWTYEVTLDGGKCACLGNRDYVVLEVSSEPHTLKVVNHPIPEVWKGYNVDTTLRIDAPNTTSPRYFRIKSSMGWLDMKLSMAEVDEATFKRETAGSQPVAALK